MSNKHLLNDKSEWASESIEGHLILNSSDLIALKEYPNVVVRRDYASLHGSNSQVALISGGGSGHEPAHSGFIGQGMLTAAVCGHLFASPSIASILAAIRFVGKSNEAGVLLIIKNYTGDRLNFGLASSRAQLEGIKVDWVLVDDDVALIDSENQRDDSVGRRGLCGTLFVHKIAGALAEQGKSLREIKETIEFILKNNHLRTIGVSLSGRVRLPGEDDESVNVKKSDSSEIEIGLGIHGEAGRDRIKLTTCADLVKHTLDGYLFKNPFLNSTNDETTNICLIVNNLGGLALMELELLAKNCFDYMEKNRPTFKLRRVFCGTLMTSLNMNGFSLTVLYLNEKNNLELVLNALDSKTNAPAWPKSCGIDLKPLEYIESGLITANEDVNLNDDNYVKFAHTKLSKQLEITIKTICSDLIDLTKHLNKLDSECGDGDCGSTLSKLSQNILEGFETGKFNFNYPHNVILVISKYFENGGGSLSILLALFTSAGAKAFSVTSVDLNQVNSPLFWFNIWYSFLNLGLAAVKEYGRAKPNQRSIVDPLSAILDSMREFKSSFKLSSDSFETEKLLQKLVDVANKSAESTAKMRPRVGRASYVNLSLINQPDAGAFAISSIQSSIYKSFLAFKSQNQ